MKNNEKKLFNQAASVLLEKKEDIDYYDLIASSDDNAFSKILTKQKMDDHQGAIESFTKEIALFFDHRKAFYSRGIAKTDLEDYRGAIADYSKAIEINPDDADTYNNRGILKLILGQIDSGCLDLSKAGELGHFDAYDVIKEYCN